MWQNVKIYDILVIETQMSTGLYFGVIFFFLVVLKFKSKIQKTWM